MLAEKILTAMQEAGVRGAPALVDGGVELHRGAVRIEVVDPKWKAEQRGFSQLHVHVVTRLIGSERETQLEACVVGMAPDEESTLEQAAELWLHLAGAPILSLLDGAEVLAADPFTGDEAWAVPGTRGFVGPVMVRGEADLEALKVAPWFAAVPEAFPQALDGEPHLVKGTLFEGRLTLELDGHAAKASARLDLPVKGIATRYALFFLPPA